MLTTNMSNSTATLSEDISVSSVVTKAQDFRSLNPIFSSVISAPQQQQKPTKKRSLPGNPDPEAEVVALSPRSLLATNRYVCEVCSKGFQRDQNLQLHRRGHNLPWKLRQRGSTEIRKKVYVCPENSCVHHNPSRALGDLTGIKKHYCRKHGEKKWKCEKCSKRYAVQSDWKAHSKTCGTREYRCDCGTLFSRKDSFITHRAFCDALAEESARLSTTNSPPDPIQDHHLRFHPLPPVPLPFPFSPAHASWTPPPPSTSYPVLQMIKPDQLNQIPNFINNNSLFLQNSSNMSATQLLQQAVNVGDAAMSNASQTQSVTHHMSQSVTPSASSMMVEFAGSLSRMSGEIPPQLGSGGGATWKTSEGLTRDFLGLADGEDCGVDGVNVNVREMLSYTTRAIEIATCIRGHPLLRPDGGLGFTDQSLSETWEGTC